MGNEVPRTGWRKEFIGRDYSKKKGAGREDGK
jgi:hypothetical protein